jgi:hypothetical protein
MEELKTTSSNPPEDAPVRPFLLTLLCLFSFVFSGLITLLFLLALLWSGTIADMVFRYAPENSASGITVFFYTFAGFVLHALSLTGIILIWKMKRRGYLLFGVTFLVIAGYQLMASRISPLTTGFYIGLIIAFGLFVRKLK